MAYPQQPHGSPSQQPVSGKTPVWIIVIVVVLVGGVALVGVIASLAIYGMRRYLAAAKTAEAKNTIGAIARGASASYERENMNPPIHKLCGSATSVPATVPKGLKYAPSPADFASGDAQNGWPCLRFSMTTPMYYQYNYHQGSGYLAPSSGAGPLGFEAAAMGDLDGDGDTSLFVVTGSEVGGSIRIAPNVFIEDEFE